MKVVIAPDSFGGRLSAREAALALAEGWSSVRAGDEVVVVPMSDGGEGLLDVVHTGRDTALVAEVCGPNGHPVEAWASLRPDGTAVIESAQAGGLALIDAGARDPMRATTYGVGELLDLAVQAGATSVLVGLGGSATVDGGAGALTGMGYRLRVADGSGLKIGGRDLHRVAAVETGWRLAAWDDVDVTLLADVTDPLSAAARAYGPQKGADPAQVEALASALEVWADVAERDLGRPGLRGLESTGAAGGLAFGLAAALGGQLTSGARAVADLVGLPGQLADADMVITGEGRLDDTSMRGKVVGTVAAMADDVPVVAVVGGGLAAAEGIHEVIHAPTPIGEDAAPALREAAAERARRHV